VTTDERRAEIIESLSDHEKTTHMRLAVEFSVSVNTIKHDILVLTGIWKYHIFTEVGRGGGVYLERSSNARERLNGEQKSAFHIASAVVPASGASTLDGILRTYS
jgi:DeoR/GlpR family transcriptional regulator of sugar metabolism